MTDTARTLHGVLVTHRRPELLAKCLRQIGDQTRALDSLVVVDNFPTGESEAVVHATAGLPRTEIIKSEENVGPAGGFALGIDRLLEELNDDDLIVLFDDNDPLPTADVLSRLVDFLDRQLSADAATAGVAMRGANFDWRHARAIPVLGEARGPVAVDHLHGNAAPLYRAGCVRRGASFTPKLFFGFEELDFGLQLTRAGHALYMDSDLWNAVRSLVAAQEPLPRARLRLEPLNWRRYYSLRNLVYILRTSGHAATAVRVSATRGLGKPLLNLPLQPILALAHLRQNLRAIRDAFAERMGRQLEPTASR